MELLKLLIFTSCIVTQSFEIITQFTPYCPAFWLKTTWLRTSVILFHMSFS